MNMKITTHRIKNCGAFVAALLLAAAPLWAQTNTSIVVGSDGTIKPTNAIPALRTALGSPTLSGNNSFTGTNTFTSVLRAPNATNVASTNIANVGTLDGRYLPGSTNSFPVVLAQSFYPQLRPGGISVVSNSAGWSGWQNTTNSSWANATKSQTNGSAAGWARASWYNFALRSGESAATLAGRGWTFAAVVNFPADNAETYGLASDLYFGSAANETGGPLTNRGLRVRIAGNDPASAYRITAAIHDGSGEITASTNISTSVMNNALIVRWLPSGEMTPGAGSELQVWTRSIGAEAVLRCKVALTNSFGATTFAGGALSVVASATNGTPGYTANWEIGGISYYIH